MKRRAALFVLAGTVALVVAAGVALAATVKCQGGMTTLCVGTDGPDTLYGTYKRDGMDAGQGDELRETVRRVTVIADLAQRRQAPA